MHVIRPSYRFVLCLLALVACVLPMGCAQAMQQRGVRITSTPDGRFVRLRDLGRFHGLSLRQSHPDGPLVLMGRGRRAEFTPQSRKAVIDGVLVWLNRPVVQAKGRWAIAEVDLLDHMEPLWNPHRFLQEQGSRTVVLDAGHGGTDSGARGGVSVEKDLTFALARDVADRLTAAGVGVRLTRSGDEFVDLSNRFARASALQADLFVSIHFNAASNPEAHGIETFVLPFPGEPATSGLGAFPDHSPTDGNQFQGPNRILGHAIHRHLLAATGAEDRGVKQARFLVLRHAPCPAVLVELGFLSNVDEERKIRTGAYREALSEGLALGILDYLRMVKQAQVMAER